MTDRSPQWMDFERSWAEYQDARRRGETPPRPAAPHTPGWAGSGLPASDHEHTPPTEAELDEWEDVDGAHDISHILDVKNAAITEVRRLRAELDVHDRMLGELAYKAARQEPAP